MQREIAINFYDYINNLYSRKWRLDRCILFHTSEWKTQDSNGSNQNQLIVINNMQFCATVQCTVASNMYVYVLTIDMK